MRRFSELKRSDRLRATGWLILAAGFISTIAFYVFKVRSADAAAYFFCVAWVLDQDEQN